MLVGYVDTIGPDLICGWAAETDSPDDVIDVLIYADGDRIACIPCNMHREDLEATGQYGRGHHGFRFQFAEPLRPLGPVRVCVRFALTGEILQGGEKTLGAPLLKPILVTAPGRSGTTLLMTRLSASPDICVAQAVPYEVRLLAYWSTVYSVLAAGPDYEHSTHPDRLEGNGYHAGSNPFAHEDFASAFRENRLSAEYFGKYVPQQVINMCRKGITEYYLRVKDDRCKPNARYFAEKSNNLDAKSREFSLSLFGPAKEIVIVRDPRDLVCSHMSYFKQTFAAAFQDVGFSCRDLLLVKKQERSDTMFVRYEELVTGDAEFARLEEFLGVEGLRVGDPEREASIFKVHATSRSATQSIERWREQLLPHESGRCNEAWAEFRAQFGYGD